MLAPLVRVTARAGLDPLAARLAEIRRWLGSDLDGLEAALGDAASAQGDLAQRAATHLLGRPGKRIRPVCVFLAARAAGGQADPAVLRELAVACELVHAATLLHDDVIDQGHERRGAPTARVLFGNPASVLGGDHLLVDALGRVRRCGQDRLLGRLFDVIGEMIAAEALQLERRGRFEPDREVYDRVVHGKTAVLFGWAMEAGAVAGGAPAEVAEALARAGTALGLAFQLVDDALDLEGEAEVTGKDALLDLREGKLTWPLIVACEQDPDLVEVLRAVALTPETLDDPLRATELRRRILATGCVMRTRARARALVRDAEAALDTLAESDAREALRAVVETAVLRAL
ncbi:MAG: polyprenyl synthetase family protein [Deltaproteobacteria bacterium]|nr:polyprenyl synthetase family protein [Deltaproteobacteria bacterium]